MTGQDDELIRQDGGELPPPAMPSEAQLAAALVMQAQALDAMRRAHSDLLTRLELGPERQELLGALEELRDSAERLRQGQDWMVRKLARPQRRLAALVAIALVLGAGGAAAAIWSALAVSSGLPTMRAELSTARSADEQSRREHAAELELLQRKADDALAEQESAQQEGRAQRERADAAEADASTSRREADAQVVRADRERDLHLEALGENARLREQIFDRDRRLDDLTRSVAELKPALAAPPPTGILPISAAAAGLPARVTSALRSSGAKGVSVVEAADVRDGSIHGLLVVHEASDDGPSRAVRTDQATLLLDEGRPVLELTTRGEEAERIALPALDRDAWRSLGLAVPAGAASVAGLSAALAALVAPQGWRVAELRGWDGTSLRGLRLEQADSGGHVSRVLDAEHGEVLPGPELELREGTLRIGEDVRPFYQGRFRLPLPGGDFGTWLVAQQAHTR